MPAITIIIGMMLLLTGVGGYGWGVVQATQQGEKASWTALIPAIIGLIILICGGIGTSVKLRKHAMHVAVAVGLLGLIAVLARLVPLLFSGNVKVGAAFASQMITAILLFILVALGVNSFIQARKTRKLN